MANVVNLNKFRKQKAKVASEKRAEKNRRWHGRTKAERAREELQKKQFTAKVDGSLLDEQSDQPKTEELNTVTE